MENIYYFRIAALSNPVRNDFNTETKKVTVKKEIYPNVFDSLSFAQQQTGITFYL